VSRRQYKKIYEARMTSVWEDTINKWLVVSSNFHSMVERWRWKHKFHPKLYKYTKLHDYTSKQIIIVKVRVFITLFFGKLHSTENFLMYPVGKGYDNMPYECKDRLTMKRRMIQIVLISHRYVWNMSCSCDEWWRNVIDWALNGGLP
jgi:hypothetical protein